MLGLTIREGVDAKDMSTWAPKYVFVVQSPRQVGDVRVPHARPSIRATSFAEMTDDELASLVDQWGFVGTTTFADNIATWHPEIEYQPPSGEADTGKVVRVGDRRFDEHALDGSFVEHWWRVASGDHQFLAIEVRQQGRLDRFLVVAGDHFVYARNRARDLPKADSLKALFESTHATRAEKIEMLDCELSYGLVRGAGRPWQIVRSTLPWREGVSLELPREVEVRGGRLVPRDGSWTIPINTFDVGDLEVMFRADAAPR